MLVHGGGLTTGNSGPFPYNMTTNGYVGNSLLNIYDGTNLVSYGGVVLVTINYASLPLDGSMHRILHSKIPFLHCSGCKTTLRLLVEKWASVFNYEFLLADSTLSQPKF